MEALVRRLNAEGQPVAVIARIVPDKEDGVSTIGARMVVRLVQASGWDIEAL